MYSRDVETYMSYCDRKGLAQRTLHSYDQTLRMFGMYLETIGIKNTEDIRHVDISNYLDSLVRRGKYTICTVKNQTQPNYPENRKDLGKPISACCINNYLRNLNAFFNWCIEEEFLRKNPIKRSDFMGTSIRSNLSRKNRYWISRHRYYELKHFCLQYSEWLTEYRSIDGYQKSSRMNLTGVKSTAISDATERLTEAKMYYFERMSLVKSLCKEADPELSDYIFKAVTEEVSYSTLRTKYDIPCSKDYYYESYRKFFWLLSNARK